MEICDRSLCSRGLGLCSLESDRRGIDNWSLWLDLKILLLTVKKVFKQEGISLEGDSVAVTSTPEEIEEIMMRKELV